MGKHLKIAKKKASQSTFGRARVGAVIVKGGRILSTGVNTLRYSKHNNRDWPSVHAEEEAIGKLLKLPGGLSLLSSATIYVSRVLKDGTTACAKPCAECQSLINRVGIKKVIHT